jgi:thiosulfate dehydrogenase
MEYTAFYYPVLWLFIAAIVIGIIVTTSGVNYFRLKMEGEPGLRASAGRQFRRLKRLRWMLESLSVLLLIGGISAWYLDHRANQKSTDALRARLTPAYDPAKIWEAPDAYLEKSDPEARLIAYGRDLIAHTQDYFGMQGLVRPGSINGLNCQNCHLDAGARPFGNNYFAVHSTYPKMRARSGQIETVSKRINDCFERSLNGEPLDTNSREMEAIEAYIRWLAIGVPKGKSPKGTGIAAVPFPDRAADPEKGKAVYVAQCASCHGQGGQGLPIPGEARRYPPLWGADSYNQGAGLFRLSRFAGYVKSNMPFGATYQNPQLRDEEAWDVAAFVNSMPRPEHPYLKEDWPDIAKKPFDHPFGPFADPFSEQQHKFGPFEPIVAFYKQKKE